MSTENDLIENESNGLYRFSPAVTEQLEEAAEIIRNLKAFGMIHTVKGVVYPEGSHQDFIDRAEKWLYKFYKK